jgi:hypothetical protein
MEPKDALLHSQESTIGPCPEPDASKPQFLTLFP